MVCMAVWTRRWEFGSFWVWVFCCCFGVCLFVGNWVLFVHFFGVGFHGRKGRKWGEDRTKDCFEQPGRLHWSSWSKIAVLVTFMLLWWNDKSNWGVYFVVQSLGGDIVCHGSISLRPAWQSGSRLMPFHPHTGSREDRKRSQAVKSQNPPPATYFLQQGCPSWRFYDSHQHCQQLETKCSNTRTSGCISFKHICTSALSWSVVEITVL